MISTPGYPISAIASTACVTVFFLKALVEKARFNILLLTFKFGVPGTHGPDELVYSCIKTSAKINELKAPQRPGQAAAVTILEQQRHDDPAELWIGQRVNQFVLDPYRGNGLWGQHHREVAATLQCPADFVVPLG
jgi:hypothetical protein